MGGLGSGGHNRKTPRQKRLAGTYRRDRDGGTRTRRRRAIQAAGPGQVVPFPVKAVNGLRPPMWLGREGVEHWYELAAKLLKLGLLDDQAENILAVACRAWEKWRRLDWRIDRDGGDVIIGYRGYPVKHPGCLARDRHLERYHRCLKDLGLTPADARRVGAEAPEDEDDAFFGARATGAARR